MSYEILTVGKPVSLIVLHGKEAHAGTNANVRPEEMDEIVASARRRGRDAGYKVKLEMLLLDPENVDGPEVQRMVAERLDFIFQRAHVERIGRDFAQGIEAATAGETA